jgi:uracil-DNA glycosylase family 4
MTPVATHQRSLSELLKQVISCRLCPRLVEFRESVKPRAAYSSETYWRRPVPGYGDIGGRLLVLGLAPALHGGNRTGRVFTGDSSGRFLVRALHAAGFANIPVSESASDGLVYTDCYLTASVKCVPPGDKPTDAEFRNCSRYMIAEIELMDNLQSVLALGSLAFTAYVGYLKLCGEEAKGLKFKHGATYSFDRLPRLYASYHPSPRNTNTGLLTLPMLTRVLKKIRSDFALQVRPKVGQGLNG